jgi:hypothetical protein
MHKQFWCDNRKERGRLEVQDIDGQIILKFITRACVLDSTGEGSKWWDLLNIVMNFRAQ